MTAPTPRPAPESKPRRVLISWERGEGGPVVSAAGYVDIAPGAGIYPRNGYIYLRSEWPQPRPISIANRRVIETVYLGPDDDPSVVAKELASGGDIRWP